jgi:hypothetical protein
MAKVYAYIDGEKYLSGSPEHKAARQKQKDAIEAAREKKLTDAGIKKNKHGKYVFYNNKGEKRVTSSSHIANLWRGAQSGSLTAGNRMPAVVDALKEFGKKGAASARRGGTWHQPGGPLTTRPGTTKPGIPTGGYPGQFPGSPTPGQPGTPTQPAPPQWPTPTTPSYLTPQVPPAFDVDFGGGYVPSGPGYGSPASDYQRPIFTGRGSQADAYWDSLAGGDWLKQFTASFGPRPPEVGGPPTAEEPPTPPGSPPSTVPTEPPPGPRGRGGPYGTGHHTYSI